MVSAETEIVSTKAKQLYESQLREWLERIASGSYVSIEPESGDHFLGKSFDDAVNQAIDKYPDRLTHTIFVGHRAALHLGALSRWREYVDEEMWALVDVSVSANAHGPTELISVWVGAAFIDRLVIPRTQIAALGLNKAFSTEAILADGQLVELETYSCWIDWFGKTYRTQVIVNDGQFPLLETALLAGRKLLIDYESNSVAQD